MKLIIMGAGYVGMALLEYWQNHSNELFITTTQAERINTLQKYGQHVMLLNHTKDNLHTWMDLCDGLIILVAPKHSHSYEETYLQTAKQISKLLQNRTKPFFLLYTSSSSVCEGIEGEVTETTPLSPYSDNPKILLETEKCYLQSNAKVCVLRLGGIYGPDRELTQRATYFSGKEMAGTGDEPTNHIHRDDIVRAIDFALKNSLAGVYHVVNDSHPTRKELYTALCESQHVPIPQWNPSLPSKRNGKYVISNQKIKNAGFDFIYPSI